VKFGHCQSREEDLRWKHARLWRRRRKKCQSDGSLIKSCSENTSFMELQLPKKRVSRCSRNADCFNLGQIGERSIPLIRTPQTIAREIWSMSLEGRRHAHLWRQMTASDRNLLWGSRLTAFNAHSRSDDDRPKGNKREQDTCLLAFTCYLHRLYPRALLIVPFYRGLSPILYPYRCSDAVRCWKVFWAQARDYATAVSRMFRGFRGFSQTWVRL
jgi:hypothetical protein